MTAATADPAWWRRLVPQGVDERVLHRAVRASVALVGVLAVGVFVVDQSGFTLFAAFGTFSLLASADLGGGGPDSRRALLGIVAVGAVLVAVGSGASGQVVVAAVVVFASVFVLQMATVLGGDVSAGELPLVIMFVVAVMVPEAPGSTIWWREAGWLTAGAVTYAVCRWWWPSGARSVIRTEVAGACRSLAAAVRASAGEATAADSVDRDEVAECLRAARVRYLSDPNRPAGPSRRDQAVVMLLDELLRAAQAIPAAGPLPDAARPAGIAAAHDELVDAIARTFELSARTVESGEVEPSCLHALDARRRAHLDAIEAWLRDQRATGGDPDQILAVVESAFPWRVLSFAALTVAADTAVAAGGEVDASNLSVRPNAPPAGGVLDAVRRGWRIVSSHLHPDAVWFRNSLRAAVGLTIAVVVADVAQLDHAFWAVLGTLSALRSNAVNTGRTALQAVLGNLVGVAVTAGLLAITGQRGALEWVLLAAVAFLAAYAPAAINLVVGQAAFCAMVLVLFDIISPGQAGAGWARLTDIGIGAAIGVVVALVLWPRGAVAVLRATVARLYAATGRGLAGAASAVLDPVADVGSVGAELEPVRRETDEAFRQYLVERGAKPVGPDQWARLVGAGVSLRLVVDSVLQLVELGLRAGPAVSEGGTAPVLREAWDERIDAIEGIAGILAGSPARATSTLTTRTEVDDALRNDLTRDRADVLDVDTLLALVLVAEWLSVVDHLVRVAGPAAGVVAERAPRPSRRAVRIGAPSVSARG